MPRKRRRSARPSPIRISPEAADHAASLQRQTGWGISRCVDYLARAGWEAINGNATKARNFATYYKAIATIYDDEQRAAERLKPKRAAARAAAALLTINGPDIADGSKIVVTPTAAKKGRTPRMASGGQETKP